MIKLASAVTPPLLTGATLASPVSVAQSVFWETVDQLWYVCQPDGTPEDMDRVTVTRLSADGALVDKMYLGRSGHGTGLCVERTTAGTFLWTGAVPNGGWATALARIPYAANGTADASDPAVVRTPRSGVFRVSASIDPTRHQLIFRWQENNVSSPTATGGIDAYDLGMAATGMFQRVRSTTFQASGKTLQGFTSLGDYIYHLYGDQSVDNFQVTCADWASGTVLQTQAVTAFPGIANREPEGICVYEDTLAFGIAGKPDGVRQLNVARFPHPGTNPWVEVPGLSPAYYPNSVNYTPQYRIAGDQVHLHFALSKTDGTAWNQGEVLFTLPPRVRPNRTQRLLGVVSGAAVTADTMAVRFEVAPDGKVTIWDERSLVGWVGADVSFWVC
ncbi:hypothetical protein [Streptomyces sp. NPDC094032]|uniref:phage baseplate protein n=1 Tax=Streptomyces sp. NPDC094032 TaxID=3155308 RepID=UPI00331EA98E